MTNPEVQKLLRKRTRAFSPATITAMEHYWDVESQREMYAVYKDGYKIVETGLRTEMHAAFSDPATADALLAIAKESGAERDAEVAEWCFNRDPANAPTLPEKVLPTVTPAPAEEVQQSPVQ